MSGSRRKVAVGAAVGALVIGAFVAGAWVIGGLWGAPSSPSSAAKNPESQPAGFACRFTAGQRFAYEVASTARIKVDFGAMIGGLAATADKQADVAVTTTWRLEVEVLSAGQQGSEPDESLLMAAWQDVKASGGGAAMMATDELAKPAILRITPNCQIRAIARHRDTSLAAARTQQAALLSLSMRLPLAQPRDTKLTTKPSTKPSTRATTKAIADGQEDTAIGRCTVRYGASGDAQDNDNNGADTELTVYKRIVRCGEVRGAPDVTADVQLATTRFLVDRGPWLATAKGEHRIKLSRKGRHTATLAGELTARRVATNGGALPTYDENAFIWGLVAAMTTDGEVGSRRWPGMTGLPVGDALDELTRLWGNGQGSGDDARGFVRAWLRANPDGAAKLIRLLADSNAPEHLRAAIYHAIGRVGGPGARRALTDALHDPTLSDGDRSRAALAIAALPRPGEQQVQALINAARRKDGWLSKDGDDVGHSAMLALGMVGHEQRDEQPELVAKVHDELRSHLKDANIGRVAEALSAMGNTGDERLLPDLVGQSQADDVDVRAKAGAALRLMSPHKTAAAAAKWLAEEQNGRVVERIAGAIAVASMAHSTEPPPLLVSTAADVLVKTADDRARRALIRLLGAAPSDAAAKKALIQAFHKGWSAQTKQLIGMYVTADELMP